jgi:hypothetical protein
LIIYIVHISFTCTADKKRDILEFFEQMNFEQMIPTRHNIKEMKRGKKKSSEIVV